MNGASESGHPGHLGLPTTENSVAGGRLVPGHLDLARLDPCSVGDTLDRGLALYRHHLRTFFVLALVFQLPVSLLQQLDQAGLRRLLPKGGLRPELVSPAFAERMLLDLGSLVIPLGGATILVLAFQRAHLLRAGSQAWLGHTPQLQFSSSALGGLGAKIVGSYLLMGLAFLVGGGISLLPGAALIFLARVYGSWVLLGLGGLLSVSLGAALFLTLYLRWVLVLPALVVEGLGPRAALRRSHALMRGRIGKGVMGLCGVRASVLVFALFVLLAIPSVLLGLPEYLIALAFTPSGAPLDLFATPLPIRLFFDLLALLTASLLAPLGLLPILIFYFDLRIRKEGLDLPLRAAQAKQSKVGDSS